MSGRLRGSKESVASDWGETIALLLLRFGLEPVAVMRFTVRQFNAICTQMARESMREHEARMIDELHDAAGECRVRKV